MSDDQTVWFYAENGSHKGPVTQMQLVQMLADGAINGETPVWSEKVIDWTALNQTELKEFAVKKPDIADSPVSPSPKAALEPVPFVEKTQPVPAEKQGMKEGLERQPTPESPPGVRQIYTVLAQGENLTDWQYFKRCVTQKYLGFSGRARRKEYWAFVLFNTILMVAAVLIAATIDFALKYFGVYAPSAGIGRPYVTYAVWLIGGLGLFLPGLAVSVRRLHDIELSGWYLLLIFVPFFGGLVLFILYLLPTRQVRAAQGGNIYGPPPMTRHFD